MKIGKRNGDMQAIDRGFVTSTEMWEMVLKFSISASQMRFSYDGHHSVHPPSSSSIHWGFLDVPV